MPTSPVTHARPGDRILGRNVTHYSFSPRKEEWLSATFVSLRGDQLLVRFDSMPDVNVRITYKAEDWKML